MHMVVIDGKAIFATHFIGATVNRETAREKLAPFQVEADGILVYPGQDVLDAEWVLRELKIPYGIEQLQPDPAHPVKVQGVKYGSRTEAIRHLLEDAEPESMVLPNLRKKLAEKDVELAGIKAVLKEKGLMK